MVESFKYHPGPGAAVVEETLFIVFALVEGPFKFALLLKGPVQLFGPHPPAHPIIDNWPFEPQSPVAFL